MKNIAQVGLAVLVGIGLGIAEIPLLVRHGKIVNVALAEPYPVPDENGDYYLINPSDSFYLPYEWEVVDPDPNGLNCRWTDMRQFEYLEGLDIYNFEVTYTFSKGERIRSGAINWDDRDLPWIAVNVPNEDKSCYVRANARYVRPLRSLRRR